MSENNKCVYLHKDKEGIVRYVGSGSIFRANITNAKSCRCKQYEDFVTNHGKLEVEIVAKSLSKIEAENLERDLFDKYQETILNRNRPSSEIPLTKEMFEKFLYYDETSLSGLRWKISVGRFNRIKANSQAGCLNDGGYYLVRLNNKLYKAHRIIVVLHGINVSGKVVDHIDRDGSNNKILNLRVVSQKENMQNVSEHKLSSINKSGVQGVHYHKRGYWVASWYEHGKIKRKYFKITKYSSSEEALTAATEYRKQMVNLYYKIKE